MTDLGALDGYSAGIFELNGAGVGAGVSETGALDPLTGAPEAHAVISRGGRLVDLGTLGGHESWAMGINDRGQAARHAPNTTPHPRPTRPIHRPHPGRPRRARAPLPARVGARPRPARRPRLSRGLSQRPWTVGRGVVYQLDPESDNRHPDHGPVPLAEGRDARS